ncbi:hypothetical protein BaRGS_00035451 [Batillaria attramentaria]|uniref:Uncharacterized protein n=1 Tax=Batillaria attramentaria TaxID=370345 RepID=A0ABD0JE29_9CAEN
MKAAKVYFIRQTLVKLRELGQHGDTLRLRSAGESETVGQSQGYNHGHGVVFTAVYSVTGIGFPSTSESSPTTEVYRAK